LSDAKLTCADAALIPCGGYIEGESTDKKEGVMYLPFADFIAIALKYMMLQHDGEGDSIWEGIY